MSTEDPQIVDCDSGTFDAAVISCDQPWSLSDLKHALVLCLIVTGMGVGRCTYYAAFDFRNKRVGLAPAVEESHDVCEIDKKLTLCYPSQ